MSTEAPAPINPAPAPPPGDIVATAGKYYRNTRYLLAAALVIWGFWNVRDGFFAWPQENKIAIQKELAAGKDPKPVHSDMDVAFNEVLGCLAPPLGIVLLVWALRNSRGEIRLSNDVLSAPGHPAVPLSSIEAVDKQKWERKGIAMVSYRTDSGKFGQIKLDDFVYDRPPIDAIFERIEQSLLTPRPRKVATMAAVPRPKMPPPPPPARR